MKDFIKKTFKFLASRGFYFTLGLFLALGVYVAQAVWNDVVTSGSSVLNADDWNEMIDQIEQLQADINDPGGLGDRVDDLESGGFSYIPVVNVYTASPATIGWTTFDASPHVPVGTKAVILQAEAAMGAPDSGDIDTHIRIRINNSYPGYILLRGRSAGGDDHVAWAGQGIFPVNSPRTFQYTVEAPGFGSCRIRLIGYVI